MYFSSSSHKDLIPNFDRRDIQVRYAVVTQGTILVRTENPVTTPTSVLRVMEDVGTIALIQWDLTDVRVEVDIHSLGIIMLAWTLMNAVGGGAPISYI